MFLNAYSARPSMSHTPLTGKEPATVTTPGAISPSGFYEVTLFQNILEGGQSRRVDVETHSLNGEQNEAPFLKGALMLRGYNFDNTIQHPIDFRLISRQGSLRVYDSEGEQEVKRAPLGSSWKLPSFPHQSIKHVHERRGRPATHCLLPGVYRLEHASQLGGEFQEYFLEIKPSTPKKTRSQTTSLEIQSYSAEVIDLASRIFQQWVKKQNPETSLLKAYRDEKDIPKQVNLRTSRFRDLPFCIQKNYLDKANLVMSFKDRVGHQDANNLLAQALYDKFNPNNNGLSFSALNSSQQSHWMDQAKTMLGLARKILINQK